MYHVNLPLIFKEVSTKIFVNFLTAIKKSGNKYFRTFWSPLRTSPILHLIIDPQFAQSAVTRGGCWEDAGFRNIEELVRSGECMPKVEGIGDVAVVE